MKKEYLIEEIKKLKESFKGNSKKNKPNHLITRRIGSFYFIFFIISVLLTLSVQLTGVNLKVESIEFVLSPYLLLIPFVLISFFCWYIHSKKHECENCLLNKLFLFNFIFSIAYIISLLLYKTSDIILLLSGYTFLVYVICYLLNKQYGYTRSWSRSEKYYFLLQSLEWEVNQIDEEKKYLKDIKLDELTSKFTKIIELQLNERQRDIIGDYLSANELLLNWTKK